MASRYERRKYCHDTWEPISRRDARRLCVHYYIDEVLATMFDALDSGTIDVIDCKTMGQIRKRPDRRRKGNRAIDRKSGNSKGE